VLSCHLD
jgi:hypothetical protein